MAAVWVRSVSGEPMRTLLPARHPSCQSGPRVAFPVDVFSALSEDRESVRSPVSALSSDRRGGVGRRAQKPFSPLSSQVPLGTASGGGALFDLQGAVTGKSVFLEFLLIQNTPDYLHFLHI